MRTHKGSYPFRHKHAAAWLAIVMLAPAAIQASAAEAVLACQTRQDPTERLACYDARFPVQPPTPAAPKTAAPGLESIARTADEKDGTSTTPVPAQAAVAPDHGPEHDPDYDSPLSKYWEIGPANRQETFAVKTYATNYLMPLHETTRINRQPVSPTLGTAVSNLHYRPLEAKYQISLRAKVAQDVLLPDASIWLAYTQQSMWQVWNHKDSAPFRSTDYQPEAVYVVPVPLNWGKLPSDWRWRLVKFGGAHQSNGQSDPLSRSWNRLYLETAFEHEDLALQLRVNKRVFKEGRDNDDNPDVAHYMGSAETRVSWLPGRATASLTLRNSLPSWRPRALILDWTYPVNRDKPGGLRWYAQFFSGYGETLIDYNFRQNSFGLGFSLIQF